MSRVSVNLEGKAYLFWLRIDTNKEFPQAVKDVLAKIVSNNKLKSRVRQLTKTRIVCDPAVFDLIQAELDVSNSCTCALFAQQYGSDEMMALVVDAKMYGKDKDAYDKILRLLRYE